MREQLQSRVFSSTLVWTAIERIDSGESMVLIVFLAILNRPMFSIPEEDILSLISINPLTCETPRGQLADLVVEEFDGLYGGYPAEGVLRYDG